MCCGLTEKGEEGRHLANRQYTQHIVTTDNHLNLGSHLTRTEGRARIMLRVLYSRLPTHEGLPCIN